MKIEEKIKEMRSKLIKKVMETDSYNKEDAIQLLEGYGLDNESATKLVLAYRSAESAKNTAKNVWNTAWQSSSGVDFSTDIAKSQQNESDTRSQFEHINARCALQMVLNQIELSEINDDVLNELYDLDIKEKDISNVTLRIAYHYYSESKAKDIKREADIKKVREYSTRIGNKMASLEKQLSEAKAENESLKNSNKSLKTSYENLQNEFKVRAENDEKHYQAALSQISLLKEKLRKLQDRGVFQTMGAKLTALFRRKAKELPEASDELPNTLCSTPSEKMGLHVPGKNDLLATNIKKESSTQTTAINQETNFDGWQQ